MIGGKFFRVYFYSDDDLKLMRSQSSMNVVIQQSLPTPGLAMCLYKTIDLAILFSLCWC